MFGCKSAWHWCLKWQFLGIVRRNPNFVSKGADLIYGGSVTEDGFELCNWSVIWSFIRRVEILKKEHNTNMNDWEWNCYLNAVLLLIMLMFLMRVKFDILFFVCGKLMGGKLNYCILKLTINEYCDKITYNRKWFR